MQKKNPFTLISIINIGLLLFSVTLIKAGNSFAGPPWYTDSKDSHGVPSWVSNPQEGEGPWFMQAHLGFDVSNIAPMWYVDPANAGGAPAWFLNDDPVGPWWSDCLSCNGASSGAQYTGGRYGQNNIVGPPWFTTPDGFPGGPSWVNNPQEGVGPWFLQAHYGFDVSNIAPMWYVDPANAGGTPAWFLNDNPAGPWWANYLY